MLCCGSNKSKVGDSDHDNIYSRIKEEDQVRELIQETMSYVLEQSPEADVWIAPSRRFKSQELSSRTFPLRMAILLLGLASLIIDLVAIAISASATFDNYKVIARTVALAAALVVTIIATVVGGGDGNLESFVLIATACIILDSSMMTLLEGSNDLFIVGIVAVIIRLAAIGTGLFGLLRINRVAMSEQLYLLHVADEQFTREWTSFDEAVQSRLGLADGEGSASLKGLQEGDLRRRILTAMVQTMEELYENYRRAETNDLADVEMGQKSPLFVAPSAGNNTQGRIARRRSTIGGATQSETLDWLRASKFREEMHSKDSYFTKKIALLLLILTLLSAGNVAFEFWKIFANQPSLFPDDDGFLDRDLVKRTSFPSRVATGLKVHVVVVDGLRDDFTDAGGSVLGDYLTGSTFAPDALRFHARAQLPSFSVPNWMTILSGSPPEDSGVTGNLQNGETHYDNIYSIAKAYNVNAGVTGTPWWANLVASSLPPLGGDGTIATDVRPIGVPKYPWESADIADGLRGAVAVQAATRSNATNPFGAGDVSNFYELFLTHFSDVDMQGHEYGIDTEWNTRDTYRGAVANKTRLIQNIVSAIDTNTILIVTSDHGHVLRGGHGGGSDILRDVPLFFYRKGSGLSMPTGTNFLPSEEPRSSFQNKYSNLDLSATITALLGLPSPRQSLGIFVEEVLQAFLRTADRKRCYYDLLLAKINLVKEYKALLDDTFFSSALPSVLTDPTVQAISESQAAFDPADPRTERDYSDLVRVVLADYHTLRNRRFDILFWRNFALSVCVAVPILIILLTSYLHSVFVRPRAIWDATHPCHALNLAQCIGGLATLVLFILLSILTYIVIYFGVVGQQQWDPTAVHTPSVAVRYLCSVLVGPIVWFTLLTKIWLWANNTIHWRVPEAIAEFQALKKLNLFFIFRWISHHVPRDIATVLIVTRQFKSSEFAKAHLYTQYLAFFVCFLTLLMLFLCFPFSFYLPAVFSVSHVSQFNIVYRFRIITVMFMMIPLQVGVIIMLLIRPTRGAENARMWDLTFLETRLIGDAYEQRLLVKGHTDSEHAHTAQGNAAARRHSLAPMLGFDAKRAGRQLTFIEELIAMLKDPRYRSNPLFYAEDATVDARRSPTPSPQVNLTRLAQPDSGTSPVDKEEGLLSAADDGVDSPGQAGTFQAFVAPKDE